MSDLIDSAAQPSAEPGRPLGQADNENTIAPTSERTSDKAKTTAHSAAPERDAQTHQSNEGKGADDQTSRFSVERGDVPDPVKRRYFSEEPQFAAELRFYTDAKAKEPAFRDTGDKLIARENNAEVIKDLVAIAQHRGWTAIDVKGNAEFRREVWMEARTAGLDVRGFKPAERDVQELERRLNARDTNSVAPSRDRNQNPEQADAGAARNGPGSPLDTAPAPERPNYDKGVTGKLLESGEQPYKHRAGQELTPFVRVEQSDGRQVEVWGVGLPAALERSGANLGDEITLRRDGVEKVSRTFEVKDRATGKVTLMQRDVPRNRWTIEAERFRSASPAEAARDPGLRDAQSRLAVVSAVVKERHEDPAVQERLIAGAKEKIADHIEKGAKFEPAKVREQQVVMERQQPERSAAKELDRGGQEEVHKGGPERTRGR